MSNHAHIVLDRSCLNFQSISANQVVTDICAKYCNQDNLVLILNIIYECAIHENFLDKVVETVEKLKKEQPTWKVLLLCNTWHQSQKKTFPADGVLYIDFFLYRIYRESIVFRRNSQPSPWNYNASKFLFLTGVPTSENRVKLLYKLQQANLLKDCKWSLFGFGQHREENIVHVCNQIPELSRDEIIKFVDEHEQTLDNITIPAIDDLAEPTYNGIAYDVNFYALTKFSIVPETLYSNPWNSQTIAANPWLTEKTWRTILNNHPFIIASTPNTLKKLNSMSFQTYEHTLPFPDYDSTQDKEDRLAKIVANAEYWTHNIVSHTNDIENMVKHNADLVRTMYFQNLDKINSFIKQHNLSMSCDDLVNTGSDHQRFYTGDQIRQFEADNHFKNFYNDIRDPSWPECVKESDFFLLPAHIQQECTTTFGYKPNTNAIMP